MYVFVLLVRKKKRNSHYYGNMLSSFHWFSKEFFFLNLNFHLFSHSHVVIYQYIVLRKSNCDILFICFFWSNCFLFECRWAIWMFCFDFVYILSINSLIFLVHTRRIFIFSEYSSKKDRNDFYLPRFAFTAETASQSWQPKCNTNTSKCCQYIGRFKAIYVGSPLWIV